MKKLALALAIADCVTTLLSQHESYWTEGIVNENFIWSNLALSIHPLFFVTVSLIWWGIIYTSLSERELFLVSAMHLGGFLTWLLGWSLAWSIAVPLVLIISIFHRSTALLP